MNFTDIFDGGSSCSLLSHTGLNGAVGDNLDTYGFDWSRDYEEWDFYVQYAQQGGDNNANVDYDGTLWNLAVGYDLDEDDKIGLSYTSYSGNAADSAAKNDNT